MTFTTKPKPSPLPHPLAEKAESVPSITFWGEGRGRAGDRALLRRIRSMVAEHRKQSNLRALHGVTVGFGLKEMLHAADWLNPKIDRKTLEARGYQSMAAGCVVGTWDGDRWLQHVFLDATYLTALIDQPEQPTIAANIVAHELAHVALERWQTEPAWKSVRSIRNADWHYEVLRFNTLNVWQEYGACRLSARHGDPKEVAYNFFCVFHLTCGRLVPVRLYRRKHWNTRKAVTTFCSAAHHAAEPLRMAAYLMGHLDGLQSDILAEELSSTALRGPLASIWPLLRNALRSIWSSEKPLISLTQLDPLVPVLIAALRLQGGEAMLEDIPQMNLPA